MISNKEDLEIGKIYGIENHGGFYRVRVDHYYTEEEGEISFTVMDEGCSNGLRSGFHECNLRKTLFELNK